ncbi:MAG: Na/Pi cotransporter family protein [Planctomycetaceae bacterium]
MADGVLGILGGLGLFLMGMSVMTEGLKDLAGNALRRSLATFTKNPFTGALTGMIGTAVIQSSSATTVMAVGFVAAGLITFPQSLGIIFGANIGTTLKGWIVAWLGFKFDLGTIVMPLIFVGALMRLFGRKNISASGYALAGFGLIFAGIAMLQHGMQGFSDIVTPESFPPNTFVGRLLLVLIGIAITIVTQSSSAGVAAAITAVHVGNISLPQAAALVIGMDIGTTATAALSALGGNVNAKRTGLAHVLFNLMTGIVSILLLPAFIWSWETFVPEMAKADPEIVLVGFHSLLNVLGVIAVLPFTNRFAALIIRLIPPQENELTRRLDPTLLSQPDVAIQSVNATLIDLANIVFSALASLLEKGDIHRLAQQQLAYDRLDEAERSLAETRRFLGDIQVTVANSETYRHYVSSLHVLDHLTRMVVRCRDERRLDSIRSDGELTDFSDDLSVAIRCDFAKSDETGRMHERLKRLWSQIDRRIEPYRYETINRTVSGEATTEEAIRWLDAVRWLRRVSYHAYRIVYHLFPASAETESVREPADEQDDLD